MCVANIWFTAIAWIVLLSTIVVRHNFRISVFVCLWPSLWLPRRRPTCSALLSHIRHNPPKHHPSCINPVTADACKRHVSLHCTRQLIVLLNAVLAHMHSRRARVCVFRLRPVLLRVVFFCALCAVRCVLLCAAVWLCAAVCCCVLLRVVLLCATVSCCVHAGACWCVLVCAVVCCCVLCATVSCCVHAGVCHCELLCACWCVLCATKYGVLLLCAVACCAVVFCCALLCAAVRCCVLLGYCKNNVK